MSLSLLTPQPQLIDVKMFNHKFLANNKFRQITQAQLLIQIQLMWKCSIINSLIVYLDRTIQQRIHFFKEFKRIHDKITYLDRIFEMIFNFWYFYELFWSTKIIRFQIFSKNKEFEILFSETVTLTMFFYWRWPRFWNFEKTATK